MQFDLYNLPPCIALQKKPKDLNVKAADMWSFAVTLWEMATREVPFADLTPMEAGMKVSDTGGSKEGKNDTTLQTNPKRSQNNDTLEHFSFSLHRKHVRIMDQCNGVLILPATSFSLQIACESLRVSVPPGISPHISKLIRICMNEDPGKRPSFDMIIPILEKMCSQ